LLANSGDGFILPVKTGIQVLLLLDFAEIVNY